MPMFARLLPAIVAVAATFIWTPAQAAAWTERVLNSFVPTGGGAGENNGSDPPLGVLIDNGTVYGSTFNGGKNNGGTIYRRDGNKVTVLYTFDDPTKKATSTSCGFNPSAVLIINQGTLYGTTVSGGQSGGGVVYSLTAKADPTRPWTCTLIKRFANRGPNVSDGYGPFGGLLRMTDGTIYGTAQSGGTGTGRGGGVLFKISPSGQYSVVHDFLNTGTNAHDGFTPAGRVVTDGTVLYGMTYFGGIIGQGRNGGVIYRFTPGSGTYDVLFRFPGASTDGTASTAQGYQPTINGLLISAGGVLYGETTLGGNPNKADAPAGVVFSFDPAKPENKAYSVLHTFDSSTDAGDGYSPFGGLNFTSDGRLIGTAQLGGSQGGGVAFIMSKAGAYRKIFDFMTDDTTGYKPGGPLVPSAGGRFIGTTYNGGAANGGVLYSLAPPP